MACLDGRVLWSSSSSIVEQRGAGVSSAVVRGRVGGQVTQAGWLVLWLCGTSGHRRATREAGTIEALWINTMRRAGVCGVDGMWCVCMVLLLLVSVG